MTFIEIWLWAMAIGVMLCGLIFIALAMAVLWFGKDRISDVLRRLRDEL